MNIIKKDFAKSGGTLPSLFCIYKEYIMGMRIGSGIDYHQLAAGRKLFIGGVEIPHHKGAVGHSDADVLLHAVCDALLGALALGDIGTHFPDTSSEFKDIDSKILLKRSYDKIVEQGYRVVNVDSTLCLQAPKIKPYISQMQKVMAEILEIDITDVSVKATTTEQMGFVGREEGLVAYATVLLEK
jgi:2-C-methyl-D-erythritol 2,4-cyclodiphosphate synthase